MFISSLKSPQIQSIFRNCGTRFKLLANSSSSLSATSSSTTTIDGSAIPVIGSDGGDGGDDGKTKTDEHTISTNKDDRPMIFMWSEKSGDSSMVVKLPKCDVVYKEGAKEKPTKRPRAKVTSKFVSNSKVEDRLLQYYLQDKPDLSDRSTVFCVYNPGESTMPEKLLNAKAKRLVILEPPKSEYLKQYQKYPSKYNGVEQIVVAPYDFNRLGAGRFSDFHNGKVDTLRQLFETAGATAIGSDDPRKWYGKDDCLINDPPVRIMGVASPFNEYSMLGTLLYSRLGRTSLYECGPVELLTAVSAQQYVDFHPKTGVDKVNKREKIPKAVRFRAQLYRYLFDINLVHTSSFSDFTPKIKSKVLKYSRGATNLYDKLEIDMEKMYWVSIRPRKCDELELLTSKDYGNQSDVEEDEMDRRRNFPHLSAFVCMHKSVARHNIAVSIDDFLMNNFSIDEPNTLIDEEVTVGGSKPVTFSQLIDVYKRLASDGGTRFYNSPFYSEAKIFVDSLITPPAESKNEKTGKKRT